MTDLYEAKRFNEQITWLVALVSQEKLLIDVEVEQEIIPAMSWVAEKFHVNALTFEVEVIWKGDCMRAYSLRYWSWEKGKFGKDWVWTLLSERIHFEPDYEHLIHLLQVDWWNLHVVTFWVYILEDIHAFYSISWLWVLAIHKNVHKGLLLHEPEYFVA